MINKRVSSISLSCKDLPYKDQPKHPRHIPDKYYKSIMNLFFKKIIYYMIRDGVKFNIPHGLGSLQILRYNYAEREKKRKNGEAPKARKMVNFNETKKLKERGIDKIVKYDNRATGGFWWTCKWYKKDHARFKAQKFYSFKFTRPNIRPNTYNKFNPELSIVPYFRDKGWEIYSELNYNTKPKLNDKD